MKYLVFAGGGGTRFWPLSRSKYPKQFLRIFKGKSTFQLTVERLKLISSMEDVIVCTSEQYLEIIKEQVPDLSPENIYLEPSRKNIAPALALCLSRLRKAGYHGNVAINWADHIIADIDKFGRTMKFADMLFGSDQLTK